MALTSKGYAGLAGSCLDQLHKAHSELMDVRGRRGCAGGPTKTGSDDDISHFDACITALQTRHTHRHAIPKTACLARIDGLSNRNSWHCWHTTITTTIFPSIPDSRLFLPLSNNIPYQLLSLTLHNGRRTIKCLQRPHLEAHPYVLFGFSQNCYTSPIPGIGKIQEIPNLVDFASTNNLFNMPF